MPYKTPDAQRKRNRQYRTAHLAEIKANQHAYYQANKERLNAQSREYYRLHKQAINEQSRAYRQSHLAQEADHHRSYYLAHRAEIVAQHKAYKHAHPEDVHRRDRKYYQAHKEVIRQQIKAGKDRLKAEVMAHYGNGKAACVRCGYDILGALVIDHIEGNGHLERKDPNMRTRSFYARLRKDGFPKGYQTLCANCNQLKALENKEHRNRHMGQKEEGT